MCQCAVTTPLIEEIYYIIDVVSGGDVKHLTESGQSVICI